VFIAIHPPAIYAMRYMLSASCDSVKSPGPRGCATSKFNDGGFFVAQVLAKQVLAKKEGQYGMLRAPVIFGAGSSPQLPASAATLATVRFPIDAGRQKYDHENVIPGGAAQGRGVDD